MFSPVCQSFSNAKMSCFSHQHLEECFPSTNCFSFLSSLIRGKYHIFPSKGLRHKCSEVMDGAFVASVHELVWPSCSLCEMPGELKPLCFCRLNCKQFLHQVIPT